MRSVIFVFIQYNGRFSYLAQLFFPLLGLYARAAGSLFALAFAIARSLFPPGNIFSRRVINRANVHIHQGTITLLARGRPAAP